MTALWLAALAAASAADVRSGDVVVIPADEVIQDDLYVSGGTIRMEGTVQGDVVVAGGEVHLVGPVQGDVLAAGGTVEVAGPVEGSVRAAGGTLIVAGSVAEDAVLAGGNVLTLPSAAIGRDVLVGAGSTTQQATVGRDVRAAAGGLVVDGRIGGDVSAETSEIQLGPRTVISGDLAYESPRDAVVAPTAQVVGQTTHEAPGGAEQPGGPVLWAFLSWLRALVGLFAAGLLLLLVLPRVLTRATEELRAQPGTSAGYGLLALVGIPVVAVLVFAVGLFIGGWWIGVAMLALLAMGLVVGFETAGLYVGRRLLAWSGARSPAPVLALLAGLVVLTLLAAVPVVGFFVVLTAILFGLGSLVVSGLQARNPRHA